MRLYTSLCATAVTCAFLVACNNTSFSSKGGIGTRNPGSSNSTPGGGGGGNGPGGNGPGGSPGGTDNRDGSGVPETLSKAALRVIYQAGDSTDTISWSGQFVFKAARSGGADNPIELFSASARQTGMKDVPGLCSCGVKNTLRITIAADQEQDLGAWQGGNIAMIRRTRPLDIDSNFSPELRNWLKNQQSNFSYGNNTIFFGGFDHVVLFGNSNGTWQTDGGWDNNDDFKAIFSCKISECPNGGAGTELEFEGAVFNN